MNRSNGESIAFFVIGSLAGADRLRILSATKLRGEIWPSGNHGYIISDKSNEAQDASLRIEMGNPK